MESTTLGALMLTAASIGFIHTLMGPDHYIPFVVMSKARNWSFTKTSFITLTCGVGHVGSSVVIGALGILAAWQLSGIEWFEAVRGNLAGWLLLGFGLAYMTWGIWQGLRGKQHTHTHLHANGTMHVHEHSHVEQHAHVHESEVKKANITPWVLFTIFVFGPCEPLIPILMYPAMNLHWGALILVTAVFSVCTIGTMYTIVAVSHFGLMRIPSLGLDRFSHALAGLAIVMCGAAIQLGL